MNRGYWRTQALYPTLGPCERCGRPATVRHHRSGDTHDNRQENVEQLCARCHARHHGAGKAPRGGRTVDQIGVRPWRRKWRAYAYDGARQVHLGLFDTPDEARAARVAYDKGVR